MELLPYVMVTLVTQYEIQLPTKEKSRRLRTQQGLEELAFQKWFGQPSYRALASLRRYFFAHLEHRNLSPGFSWLAMGPPPIFPAGHAF